MPSPKNNSQVNQNDSNESSVDLNASQSRITELRAQLAAEENKVTTAKLERLKTLHTTVGMENPMELIKSLKAIEAGLNPFEVTNGGGRTRATITDETRAKVKDMVGRKMTGEQISAQLGISVPSVQNIKKGLGLINARTPAPAVAAPAAGKKGK